MNNFKSIKHVKEAKQNTDSDYAFMPMRQQATLIREGTLFPDQLIDIYLSRIEKYNLKLNALIEVYAEDARVLGKCATIEAKNGLYRGKLHGVPIVIKDLIDIKNRQSTLGSMTHVGRTARITATLVKRLQKEGMIIIGKTHTVEFAFGGWGTNHYMGTPFNPWDDKLQRVPGGSSSGSSVAVSTGLASAGIGTDTGGSVRIPASMCGIVGLKPTYGRISTAGVSPLSPTFDSVGPITRCVEDAAILYSLMEGPDLDDPETMGLPHMNALCSLKKGIEGYRLAVPADRDLYEVDEAVINGFFESIKVAEKLGSKIFKVCLPESFSRCVETMSTIMSVEAYHHHGKWVEEHEKIDPNVRTRIMAGKTVLASDYVRAQTSYKKDSLHFAEFLSDYDALLTPTTQTTAVPLQMVQEEKTTLARFTRPVNYFKCCAIALPMGLDNKDLPMSLQVVGIAYSEAKILRIAWALEQRGGLQVFHPPAFA